MNKQMNSYKLDKMKDFKLDKFKMEIEGEKIKFFGLAASWKD
jgi:hypothetical protein